MKMREIKFRGKRVDNGEWVYGLLVNHIIGEFAVLNNGYLGDIEVIEETVCQFTGLNDKNGREIYNCDILLTHRNISSCLHKGIKFEVYYNEFLCHFALIPLNTQFKYSKNIAYDVATLTGAKIKYLEIIGNIHDNPELLK